VRVGIKQIISRAVTKRIRKGKLTQILKVGDGGNKHCIAGVWLVIKRFVRISFSLKMRKRKEQNVSWL